MDWGWFVAGSLTAVLLALRIAKLEMDCIAQRKRNDAWTAWFEEAYPNAPWPDSVMKADGPCDAKE